MNQLYTELKSTFKASLPEQSYEVESQVETCLANVVDWCRSKFNGVDIIPVTTASSESSSTVPLLMQPLRNYLKVIYLRNLLQ